MHITINSAWFLVSSRMQIQQKSYSTFQIKCKNGDVVLNPTSTVKDVIALHSLPESPYLNYTNDESVLTINSAGEYEAKDIFITGKKVSGDVGLIYTVNGDDITVGVVSFITTYSSVPVELFENVDILILGGGGGMHMPPKDAHELIQKVSPKICILHGFEEQGSKDVKASLLPLDEVKKDIPALTPMAEKVYKVTKDELDRIDDTQIYFFEL